MNKDLILIGKVTGTFGIRGELKIYSESDFVDYRFRKGAIIIIGNSEHKVSSFRVHKGNVLITIDECDNINLVLDKVGMDVYADSNDVPPLNEDEYYIDDLIGLKVYNQHDEELGCVSDVVEIPSGYLLEIKSDKQKKFLVPFVDEYIIDVTDEAITINEIEGIR